MIHAVLVSLADARTDALKAIEGLEAGFADVRRQLAEAGDLVERKESDRLSAVRGRPALEALLGPNVSEAASFDSSEGNPTSPGLPASLLLSDMLAGIYQPRTRMDEGALYELAESIKAQHPREAEEALRMIQAKP